MNRTARIILILTASLAVLAGCRAVDIADPAPDTPDGVFDQSVEPSPESRRIQSLLAALWRASDHGDWDVISGYIDPATGGVISGTPASWPEGYVFSVDIAPGSISQEGLLLDVIDPQPLIEISILVPRYQEGVPPKRQYPAVYELLPHGLQFTEPAVVTFCYPFWCPEYDTYTKFYFFREPDGSGGWVYDYSDLETVAPADPSEPHLDVSFETNHFSRWGMQNGGGGNGIIGLETGGQPRREWEFESGDDQSPSDRIDR